MAEFAIETPRLVLREWRAGDVEPMLGMRQDPRVMATLGPVQTRKQVEDAAVRQAELQRTRGYCSWIVESKGRAEVIGSCGLQPIAPGTPLGDVVEIGWKLRHDSWGSGYAYEAANAVFEWSWANRPGERIYAIAARTNARSIRLMERLAMTPLPDCDFDHPRLAPGDPLRPHVAYVKEPPQ